MQKSYLLFFFDKVEPMILASVIWSARTVWFRLVRINIVVKDIVHINHVTSGHWPRRRGRSPREPRKTSFGHDWTWRSLLGLLGIVVHVDYEKHRLVIIDLGNNVVVYVDYTEQRLVMIDLREEVIVYVDYAENIVWSWHTSETRSSST